MQARAITHYLQAKGFDTETLSDGALALQRLKVRRFDVLVTDLTIPTVGGEALAEWGLRHGGLQKVVVISGKDLTGVAIPGACGRVKCIQKPFSLDELFRCMQFRAKGSKQKRDVAEAASRESSG